MPGPVLLRPLLPSPPVFSVSRLVGRSVFRALGTDVTWPTGCGVAVAWRGPGRPSWPPGSCRLGGGTGPERCWAKDTHARVGCADSSTAHGHFPHWEKSFGTGWPCLVRNRSRDILLVFFLSPYLSLLFSLLFYLSPFPSFLGPLFFSLKVNERVQSVNRAVRRRASGVVSWVDSGVLVYEFFTFRLFVRESCISTFLRGSELRVFLHSSFLCPRALL